MAERHGRVQRRRAHLRGPNGGLVLHDLQRALDPAVPERVTSGRPVEVKDHPSVRPSCQLEEGLQAADRLLCRPQPVLRPQRAGRTERIELQGTNIDT